MFPFCFSGEFFMFGVSSLCPVCGTNLVLHGKNEKGERVPCVPQEKAMPIPAAATPQQAKRRDWAI